MKKEGFLYFDLMLLWVSYQNERDIPDDGAMGCMIECDWDGVPSYCVKYYDTPNCPLQKNVVHKLLDCDEFCCNGYMSKMREAGTWKTWIKYAKLSRQYLEEYG
jgi:hypothetical protein